MIWEKFVEIQGGQVTPLPLPGGAHAQVAGAEFAVNDCIVIRSAMEPT